MIETDLQKKLFTTLFKEDIPADSQLAKWQESAFTTAVEKLHEQHGNLETVMQTGEAFGRGLYASRLNEKTNEWTIKKWLEATDQDVFKPLGTEFTFTKISPDAATTFLSRDPLNHLSKESTIASLFTYGVIRGLFLSAFPKGELLVSDNEATQQHEFIFKTHASIKDRFERERVKRVFSPKRD